MTSTKIDNYVIIANLKSEPMRKLINRIPGLRLFCQVYQARLQERMLNRSAEPRDSTTFLKALLGSLAIQQAFSKPCLVNLISKDTHLVFSLYNKNIYHMTSRLGVK